MSDEQMFKDREDVYHRRYRTRRGTKQVLRFDTADPTDSLMLSRDAGDITLEQITRGGQVITTTRMKVPEFLAALGLDVIPNKEGTE
jgi:hypothetical protein